MKITKIDEIIALLTESAESLSLEELVVLHKKLVTISKVALTVKNHIVNALLSGQKINGYKLVKTKGRTAITDPREASRRLVEYFRETNQTELGLHDVLVPVSLDTLRKLLSPTVVADMLSGLISSGGEGKSYDYAPIDDERDEVKPENKED